ncbi:MAG: InlB B-repeat-containing protein [Campylobacteraceae bacterium]|jgi:hypothetical protein|nr:InlB B-repeat-containing protein [Campylobacteraceae bacterium]
MFGFLTNALTVNPSKHQAALASSTSKDTTGSISAYLKRKFFSFSRIIPLFFVAVLLAGCGNTVAFIDYDNRLISQAEAGTVFSSVTVPAAPVRAGYIFTEWKEVNGTATIAANATSYRPTKSITFFQAQYRLEGDYAVSFYDANLEFLGVEGVSKGNSIDLSNKYGISNWYKVGQSASISGAFTPTEDITLYASAGVTEVKTQTELAAINRNAASLAGRYILQSDIALGAGVGFDVEGWFPIGYNQNNPFTGVFNGNGHTISGLWINSPSTDYIGLFGTIKGGEVKNLGVVIDTYGIRGDKHVGGIVGYITDGSITNSYTKGNVDGYFYVGGIAGISYHSDIINSYTTGSVSGTGEYIGGIAGAVWNYGSIVSSYATGNVNGVGAVGGIAGENSRGSIAISYSTGNVNTNRIAGGIVGTSDGGSIANSYATGSVSGTDEHIGGIVGYSNSGTSIVNSYSTGIIGGPTAKNVGGITGFAYGSSITNNVAINPSISGSENVNRVVGYIKDIYSNTILNNLARSNLASPSDDDAYAGLGTPDNQFKLEGVYVNLGWYFNATTGIWKIDSSKNNGYPYLYWQAL